MPDLEIGEDLPVMAGVRVGPKRLPDGYTLRVRITLDTVTDIAYFNPTADYAEPTAPSYPVAAGVPGAPFEDRNLKLVVLSALLDAKIVVRNLESISVSVEPENIEALLDMPSLKHVRVVSDRLFRVAAFGTPTRQLFEALKAHGVSVSAHWATTSDPSQPALE